MVSQQSNDFSEGSSSDRSLGHFVRELAATLRELNGSVVLMTQYIVDGVINNDLRSALEATAVHSSAADTETFVVVSEPGEPADAAGPTLVANTEPAPTADTEMSAVPASCNAEASNGVATVIPAKWYAIIVGRNPGIYQGPNQITTNIERIPGGLALKFDTEAQAKEAFDTRLRAGLVKQVELTITEQVLTYEHFYGPQQQT